MSEPTSFTQEAIQDFMILRGGKVTNHELVKHFKKFLTNPATQEEARVQFKEFVNNLATITRDPDGGKQLVLKKRYRTPSIDQSFNTSGLPATPLSPTPLENPPLSLRYQPVYQSSFELDLGSPHRSPYRRLSSESLTSSYSLRSPGTPTHPVTSPTFPVASSYHQLISPSGYASPPLQYTRGIPSSPPPSTSTEPPLGIPIGVSPAFGHSQALRAMPKDFVPKPLNVQNASPSLPSIPSVLEVSTSSAGGPPMGMPQSSSASNITSQSFIPQQFRSSPSSPVVSTPSFRLNAPRRQLSNDSVFLESNALSRETDPPPVPPRRRSSDKSLTKTDLESSGSGMSVLSRSGTSTPNLMTASQAEFKHDENKENVLEDSKISVKERMQKFDRMASESALLNKNPQPSSLNANLFKKRQEKVERDEEDSGSVTLIDAKSREWLVKCAQGEYQAMVKMAAENPKLVKFKDPSGYTALHWGAKHGNEDVIKLIAGTHGANVNTRTNGGYTALHIAMQYGHDECCNLLVDVYGADPNIRDYSGRKPRQYQTKKGTSVSADTFRKIKAMKKHAAEKDLRFLRIGSLNVRVKRTTEAFSHFLGVGNPEKLHKHWGSADNLHQGDNRRMPPPKFAPIKKRKSKRGPDFVAARTHSLLEKRPETNNQDSDSDTAAGFGSSWQSTV